jgi:hypothetical protein
MKLDQLKIPTLKPRDSGHRVLAAKVNAAGPHRDKKAELKRGTEKHKGRSVYEASIEEAEGKVPHKMAGRADAIQKRLKTARLAKQRELESSYEDDDEKPVAKQKVDEKSLGSKVGFDSYEEWMLSVPTKHTVRKVGNVERVQAAGKDFEGVCAEWDDDKMSGWIYTYYLDKKNLLEKFHLSDAPEAKGKFKELSADALADWLIKTRSGDGKRIYGSLSQQIVFNKDNPAYKKKMEATIAAVKRKLKDKQ